VARNSIGCYQVSLQASTSSTAQSLRVTLNLGVWLGALSSEGETPDVWSAHWRARIGSLMPQPSDRWWDASSDREAAAVAVEMSHVTKLLALPAFEALSTADALADLWRSGRSPGLTEFVAKRFLDMLTRKMKIGS
jgi:hypothetical protein